MPVSTDEKAVIIYKEIMSDPVIHRAYNLFGKRDMIGRTICESKLMTIIQKVVASPNDKSRIEVFNTGMKKIVDDMTKYPVRIELIFCYGFFPKLYWRYIKNDYF
jgi:hypothetical protein